MPKLVVSRAISTIKDEKSAVQFHYIKTVSGRVVAQSIAFRVVPIYWHGLAPFPSYLNAKWPTPIGSTCVTHTSPHSAAAVRYIGKSLITAKIQSKTGFSSSHQLMSYVFPKSRPKLAAHCAVSGCCLLVLTSVKSSIRIHITLHGSDGRKTERRLYPGNNFIVLLYQQSLFVYNTTIVDVMEIVVVVVVYCNLAVMRPNYC